MLRLVNRSTIVRFNSINLAMAATESTSLFAGLDRAEFNVFQNTMLDTYGAVEELTGLSSIAAIPVSIIAVRTLLLPAYVKTRLLMPRYQLEAQKMNTVALKAQLLMNPMAQPSEEQMAGLREEMTVMRGNIMRSFPIFWMLPNGIFMSANFFTLWNMSKASTTPFIMPLLETNIFECSIACAALGSGLQLAALLRGAEMGKIANDDMPEQQRKAAQMVTRVFAVGMGATLPLQVYYDMPALLSLMWALNTVVTISFSQSILNVPSLAARMDLSEETKAVTKEIEELTEKLAQQKTDIEFMHSLQKRDEELKRREEVVKEATERMKREN